MEANGKRLRTTMTATGDSFMNHLEAIVRIKSAANVFALLARVKQILLRKDFGNAHGYAMSLCLAQRMVWLRLSMSTATFSDLIMLKKLLILFVFVGTSIGLFAQKPAWQPATGHLTLPLWPNGAPGASVNPAPEVDTTTAKDNLVAGKPLIRLGNVSIPTLTLYTPKGKNTGAAVVVFPGGSYHILAIDLEGTEVCDWLNSIGVNCILVKYRVPDSGPYPKSSAALEDAQRALGIVRMHDSGL